MEATLSYRHTHVRAAQCVSSIATTHASVPTLLSLPSLPSRPRCSRPVHNSLPQTTTRLYAKRPNRGKALLNGNLRAPSDDALLTDIADKLKPDQEIRMVQVRVRTRDYSFLRSRSWSHAPSRAPLPHPTPQWYPGHIAKAEAALKEQLKSVDMVLEVRDGRIPMSTRHPSIPKWVGGKPRVMILNRRDMVSNEEADAWAKFFRERGHGVVWTNANKGDGVASVIKQALKVSETMNEKRTTRGLKPRPVRAVVVGFPNVGKSALINRLLGRRVADSAPRPGVTRSLRWMRIGGDLDLLDAPGIIPMSFKNQNAAQKLAMCNDIGEASYIASMVAAALLSTFDRLPCGDDILDSVEQRYGIPIQGTVEDYVIAVADRSFNSEPERAGQRILRDFRDLKFGRCCLELPEDFATFTDC